jgi:sterol O-acyltransferase
MASSSSSSKNAKAAGNVLVGGDESGSPILASAQEVIEASAPEIAIASGMTTPDETADESTSTDNSRSSSPEQQRTRTTITTSTTSGTADGTGRQMATTVQYTGAAAVSSDVGKDGTLHIHPIPSRKDRKVKVKKVISFIPRTSHFDRFHPTSQGDPFRGFYVLFWLMMGLTMSRVLYHGYLRSGEFVGMRFAKLISEDAIVLGISDGILVGSTILSVPFMKVRLFYPDLDYDDGSGDVSC